jgi:REP element-mobilizing transposase RayT
MARKARVEFAGGVYHVLDRGNRREAIFRDDGDRRRFLETLGEACARTGWRVHAFVLMSNHYHFMIETPQRAEKRSVRAYVQRGWQASRGSCASWGEAGEEGDVSRLLLRHPLAAFLHVTEFLHAWQTYPRRETQFSTPDCVTKAPLW